MKPAAETITARELHPLFEVRRGICSRSLVRAFLRVSKARIVGRAGQALLYDRAEVFKLLLARYPRTKAEQDAKPARALEQATAPKGSLFAPPPPPLPDPLLAKVNLASWAVAAYFRMVRDLRLARFICWRNASGKLPCSRTSCAPALLPGITNPAAKL